VSGLPENEDALSEFIGVVLIIFFVLIAALAVFIILFGSASPTEKTAFVALLGEAYTTSTGNSTLACSICRETR